MTQFILENIEEPHRLAREEIHAIQTDRMRRLFDEIADRNPFWRERFASNGIDPRAIKSLGDLSKVPLTTKQDLVANHTAHPPFGTNLTYPLSAYCRLHQTSGTTGRPLRWLDTAESWSWFARCWRQIYQLAGVTPDDRIFFPFSFGPFIGFWAAFEGASRLENLVVPTGGMSSEARLGLMIDVEATVVCCTPTYALRLMEIAQREKIDLAASAVRLLIVAGEPGGNIPSIKKQVEETWNATMIDHWGMTEIGSLATAAFGDPTGLYVLETECIPEILDPSTGEAVSPGEVGELIITNLGRIGSPLIRYRTGDLVQASTNPSPIGLELLRLEGGIQGRVDDMVTIRGNNVYPTSIEAVVREFSDILEFRIVIQTVRAMKHLRLDIEPHEDADAEVVRQTVSRAIKDRLSFVAEVQCVPLGTLPRFEMKGKRLVREDQAS